LSVQIDPATKRVLSFTASKTETSPVGMEPASVTTASISGSDIPFGYYLEAPKFTPYLECYLDGEAVCQRIDGFQYRVERGESEWLTVVPWTEMTGFTCADADWTPEIVVSFSAE
jgi:hypothetical protein